MVMVVNVLCFFKKSNYFKIISPKYFTVRYSLPKVVLFAVITLAMLHSTSLKGNMKERNFCSAHFKKHIDFCRSLQ